MSNKINRTTSPDSVNPAVPLSKKAERAQLSRQALIDSARRLFEEKGYAATSTEELLAETGLTRGALYHHFKDKRALFEAVCDVMHAELVDVIEHAIQGLEDPRDILRQGTHAWLKAVSEPRRSRVLLVEAPAVLGMEAWNDADRRHGYASLREGVAAAYGGPSQKTSLDAIAVALNGAMNALAGWVAADATRLDAALAAIDGLLAAHGTDGTNGN
jgi:AcrR family transcriptional regulator